MNTLSTLCTKCLSSLKNIPKAIWSSFVDSLQVARNLYPVIIIILIITKILTELDLLKYLAIPLEPIMSLVGLPADMGLAWMAGMIVNLYSAILLFFSLIPAMEPMSVAQMTIFGVMLLLAHNIIIEGQIAAKCKVAMIPQMLIRFVVAIIGGFLLNIFFKYTNWLSEPAVVLMANPENLDSIFAWSLNEALNLFKIFFVIWSLMLLQRGLDHFHISNLLQKIMYKPLRWLGISSEASFIIIIAFSMGLLYGSGLIIKQAHKFSHHDIFCAITLMSLAHALIEDTLLVMLLGANIWGVLFFRIVISMLATVIIIKIYDFFYKEKTTNPN